MDVVVLLKPVVLFTRKYTERMGTEIITLALDDIGRKDLAPIAIKECQSRAESGCWDTPENSLSNDTSPARLCVVNG